MLDGSQITTSLTAKDVENWSGVRKGWTPSQQGAMGKLSADDAARAAGVIVSGQYHWLHLVAFSMGGLDKRQPNVPENLLVGTEKVNMIHQVVERAAKKIASESSVALILSATPDGAISPEYHVFHRLHYFIRRSDAPFWLPSWHITLELLDHTEGHHGDYNFVYKSMKAAILPRV